MTASTNPLLNTLQIGENWTPIEENINESRIVRKNLDVRARYIRLRVTGFTDPNNPNKHDFWTRVREFTVNKSANTPAQIYSDAGKCRFSFD